MDSLDLFIRAPSEKQYMVWETYQSCQNLNNDVVIFLLFFVVIPIISVYLQWLTKKLFFPAFFASKISCKRTLSDKPQTLSVHLFLKLNVWWNRYFNASPNVNYFGNYLRLNSNQTLTLDLGFCKVLSLFISAMGFRKYTILSSFSARIYVTNFHHVVFNTVELKNWNSHANCLNTL